MSLEKKLRLDIFYKVMRLSFEQNQKTYNSQTVSGEFKAGSIPAMVI